MFYHDHSCLCLYVSHGSDATNKVAVWVVGGGGPGVDANHNTVGAKQVGLSGRDSDLGDAEVVRDHEDLLCLPS